MRNLLLETGLLSITWSTTQLGGEGGATTANETYEKMKLFMRVSAVVILPISASFPTVSALFCTCVYSAEYSMYIYHTSRNFVVRIFLFLSQTTKFLYEIDLHERIVNITSFPGPIRMGPGNEAIVMDFSHDASRLFCKMALL